jgi:molecular chaperone DnaK (HSP70)
MRSFSPAGYEQSDILPSVVYLQDPQTAFVGQFARHNYLLADQDRDFAVKSIKRHMGSTWRHYWGGRTWTPEDISGMILKAIKSSLDEFFGYNIQGVTITVPSAFSTDQRNATIQAAELAGFDKDNLALLDEPVAALLNYIFDIPNFENQFIEGKNLMVIDIGGGTFDVSILSLQSRGNEFEIDIIGRCRYNELAGDDFDTALAAFLMGLIEASSDWKFEGLSLPDQRKTAIKLIQEAERAKKTICQKAHEVHPQMLSLEDIVGAFVPILITDLPQSGKLDLNFTHKDLNEVFCPFFVEHTDRHYRRTLKTIFKPIEEAFEVARTITGNPQFGPNNIAEVILAGGSSLLPNLHIAVKKHFMTRHLVMKDPLYCVAKGAAIYNYWKHENKKIKIKERLLENVYIRRREKPFYRVIKMDTEIPSSTSADIADKQLRFGETAPALKIEFYRGLFEYDPLMSPFGSQRIEFDEFIKEGTPIELTYDIDTNKTICFHFGVRQDDRLLKGDVVLDSAIDVVERLESAIKKQSLPQVNPRL